MTTILAIFIIALVLSLVLSPLAGRFGIRFGAVDYPEERKDHTRSLARCGGIGIFLSFLLTLVASSLFISTSVSSMLVLDSQMALIFLGALIVFGIGLFDDFHRLGSTIKFLFQILGATLAFFGGLQIGHLDFFGVSLHFGILSYFITVFWFVLLINAVNLIDGLDGLAGGITFFACAVMVILAIIKGNFLIAMLFAALGGSTLGFLRYNFNPATIFLGDGGSYFLGYSIAALSIMGSIKSQMGVIMLIPMVGLGVPVFDTILSPIRRFIIGQDMFNPDKGHIHHRLVQMGVSTKRVVWIIYGISICLCAFALLLVNLRDEQVGLFLIVLAAASVIFLRKLGYFEYFTADKIFGWLRDLSDEAGIRRDRRTFLSMQMNVAASENMYQLWGRIIRAAEKINLSAMALELHPDSFNNYSLSKFTWENRATGKSDKERENDVSLGIELPLVSNGKLYATLSLKKSLNQGGDDPLVLRRVEHLKRSIAGALEKLAIRSLTCPEVLEDRRRPDNHKVTEWNWPERRSLSDLSE